ncbi:MAG: alpha-2-macroglobulin family protein, partial [Fusobacterium sp.]|nr:alpha-2-macroglobulin family protein [Fusobacterium sp.]
MKNIKNYKVFLKIFLLIFVLSFTACKEETKNKVEKENQKIEKVEEVEEVKLEVNQNFHSKNEQELYINTVAFNNNAHIVAVFSKELDKNQNFREKIALNPEVENLKIETYGNKIILKGNFEKEREYFLTFDKNILDINEKSLNDSYNFSNLYVKKKEPNLSFSSEASILPSLNNKRINFTSTNIKKVKLEVIKVYMNNITDFLKVSSNNFGNTTEEYKENLGDIIFSKEYNLEMKADELIKNSIDLSSVIDKKGIYHIKLYVDDEKNIDYDEEKYGYINFYEWFDGKRIYAKAEKNIILSDLGVLASSNENKLNLQTININNLEKMENTKLEFINKKNQLIEEGQTNSNGEYKSKSNLDDIYYVLAKKNEEFNILYLNKSLINYSDFDIGGLTETSDFRIFTYTDKGYYRPGDEIFISLIARNKNKNIEETHPFTYTFTSPNGVDKIKEATVKNSKNGFYTFKINSDINDETGAWNLKIKFGDKEINKNIFIDAEAPNRIAIDIEDKIYTKENLDEEQNIAVDVFAKYLTGAKASGNKTSYSVSAYRKNIKSKKYKNYVFNNPTAEFSFRSLNLNGNLNEEGKENIKISIPKHLQKFSFDIFISANVLDTNGRYSTENKKISFENSNDIIGLKKIEKDNGKVLVKFLVLNPKTDKLVEGKKIKYRLFNQKYNWWYDSYNNNENYIKNSLDTSIIDEGTYVSSSEEKLIELSNLEEGINFLELEDEETGISSGIFIYNFSYGEKAKNGMENLNISLDKEKYNVGDVAKVKFNGTAGAKALISIEKNGKILKEYWKNLEQKNNEELIQIEKEFSPNAYVNVSVFQKYKDKENDRPLRLYGTVPLIVYDKEKELNIEIDSKSEVEPLSSYKLKISNKEKQKMYFQYYLVDEGVLRITDYKLPEPLKFFYGKEAKLVKNYDNFSNIIEKYSNDNVRNYLTTGGGEYATLSAPASLKRKALTGNMDLQGKAKRFKNISIVSEILETDENGFAEVNIKIPNYFGAMKIFVVAVADDKFGSTEKELTIKAPVVVEASAPRVIKVGDKFSIPITLFPIEDNLGNGKLSVKYEGQDFVRDIKWGDKENQKLFFELSAPEKVGETKIEISYKSEKYNFKDEINLNVDSSFPEQYISENKILKAGEEFKINSEDFKDFISGSLNGQLSLSSYKILGLNKVIASLLDYPYICLEQTTSKARAMLAISKLSNNKKELNTARTTLNTIIKKLFNNYQLQNGGFTYWPGNTYVNNKYSIGLIEFLFEAKKQGYYIPEQMYNLSVNYLKNLLNSTDITIENKVDILYNLAFIGEANISEMNIIFDKDYHHLPLASKWKLLDTYNYIGENSFAKKEADKLAKDNSHNIYGDSLILKSYKSIYGKTNEKLFDNLLVAIKNNEGIPTYIQASIVEAISKNIDDTERKDLAFEIIVDSEVKNYSLENGQFNFEEINNILKEKK